MGSKLGSQRQPFRHGDGRFAPFVQAGGAYTLEAKPRLSRLLAALFTPVMRSEAKAPQPDSADAPLLGKPIGKPVRLEMGSGFPRSRRR